MGTSFRIQLELSRGKFRVENIFKSNSNRIKVIEKESKQFRKNQSNSKRTKVILKESNKTGELRKV